MDFSRRDVGSSDSSEAAGVPEPHAAKPGSPKRADDVKTGLVSREQFQLLKAQSEKNASNAWGGDFQESFKKSVARIVMEIGSMKLSPKDRDELGTLQESLPSLAGVQLEDAAFRIREIIQDHLQSEKLYEQREDGDDELSPTMSTGMLTAYLDINSFTESLSSKLDVWKDCDTEHEAALAEMKEFTKRSERAGEGSGEEFLKISDRLTKAKSALDEAYFPLIGLVNNVTIRAARAHHAKALFDAQGDHAPVPEPTEQKYPPLPPAPARSALKSSAPEARAKETRRVVFNPKSEALAFGPDSKPDLVDTKTTSVDEKVDQVPPIERARKFVSDNIFKFVGRLQHAFKLTESLGQFWGERSSDNVALNRALDEISYQYTSDEDFFSALKDVVDLLIKGLSQSGYIQIYHNDSKMEIHSTGAPFENVDLMQLKKFQEIVAKGFK